MSDIPAYLLLLAVALTLDAVHWLVTSRRSR